MIIDVWLFIFLVYFHLSQENYTSITNESSAVSADDKSKN